MKIVDIADEVFRDLEEPSSLSIPPITYWLRANIGTMNSYINSKYEIEAVTLEIVDECGVLLKEEEKSILKKMYMVHYYDNQLRSNLIAISTDTVISVTDDNSSVVKINKNEVSKVVLQAKKQESEELQKMITAYKLSKVKPRQVAGDDLESLNSVTKYDTEFNRISNN
tara:strand:- start:101 stop:607 length:507 start_codon:yes stop_codon:yes gene_type:complete